MEIIISLSSTNTELMPVASPKLTPQAQEAADRAEQQRIEREYAGQDLSPKEIKKKEEERKEKERAEQDDPNRLPKEMPQNIGQTKISDDATAITITNRHDNLPDAQI